MENFEYSPEIIRELQLTELQMLKAFDQICRKYNIKYIIDAGTLLGAVRYGGFIPWDDDVDVRMLRDEYERFCKACKKELNTDYFLQNNETDPGYRWGYARLLKNDTVFLGRIMRNSSRKMAYLLTFFRAMFCLKAELVISFAHVFRGYAEKCCTQN